MNLRVIDDCLPLRCPASEFQVRLFIQICYDVTADCGAYSTFTLVLECRVLDG
jgi:hypothetical protein